MQWVARHTLLVAPFTLWTVFFNLSSLFFGMVMNDRGTGVQKKITACVSQIHLCDGGPAWMEGLARQTIHGCFFTEAFQFPFPIFQFRNLSCRLETAVRGVDASTPQRKRFFPSDSAHGRNPITSKCASNWCSLSLQDTTVPHRVHYGLATPIMFRWTYCLLWSTLSIARTYAPASPWLQSSIERLRRFTTVSTLTLGQKVTKNNIGRLDLGGGGGWYHPRIGGLLLDLMIIPLYRIPLPSVCKQ